MAIDSNPEKMQVVIDSLRANPDVVVVGGFKRNYLETGAKPTPYGYWSRTLDIYTHPVDPMYNADELNDFMFGLVPELEPTTVDRFYDFDRELRLGKLYFDEAIGTVATTSVVKLKSGLSVVNTGELDEEWTAEQSADLLQRTWVRVFPTVGHLTEAAAGTNQHNIPRSHLGRAVVDVASNLYEAPVLGGVIEATVASGDTPALKD